MGTSIRINELPITVSEVSSIGYKNLKRFNQSPEIEMYQKKQWAIDDDDVGGGGNDDDDDKRIKEVLWSIVNLQKQQWHTYIHTYIQRQILGIKESKYLNLS